MGKGRRPRSGLPSNNAEKADEPFAERVKLDDSTIVIAGVVAHPRAEGGAGVSGIERRDAKEDKINRDVRGSTRMMIGIAWVKRISYLVCLRLQEGSQGSARAPATGSFRIAHPPHRYLAATSSSGHGHRFQATETPGRSSLLVERGNRDHESRERGFEHDTSQSPFWLRWHSFDDDQSTFHPLSGPPSQVHRYPGLHGQRHRLRRARVRLRRCMRSPRPGNEREDRSQSARARSNKPVDHVG